MSDPQSTPAEPAHQRGNRDSLPSPDTEDVTSRDVDQVEDGEVAESEIQSQAQDDSDKQATRADTAPHDAPPIPNEPLPAGGPPLPNEPLPDQAEDDGWDCHWDPSSQSWFFANRFTGLTQWTNPRVTNASDAAAAAAPASDQPSSSQKPPAGGYNPAIHGSYDPTAWYAQGDNTAGDDGEAGGPSSEVVAALAAGEDPAYLYGATAGFNRFTGQYQTEDQGPGRHTDEAKAKRQMNAFFDVDAAANVHNGRSLKAERSNQKITKKELKQFKEKRRAKKEEKRRAWLKD